MISRVDFGMRRARFTVSFLSSWLSLVFFSSAGLVARGVGPDVQPQIIAKEARWKNVTELKRFAAQGDVLACLELGERLLHGDGVPVDPAAAREFFAKAAAGGSGDAMFRLGKLHHDGTGGPRDFGAALDFYGQAARAGIPEAQHNIGAMLVSARGVRRDYVEGLAWLIVATKNGALSDAEQRTRARLEKRPADIAKAEARAAELQQALAAGTGGPNDIAAPRYTLAGASALPSPPNPATGRKLSPPVPVEQTPKKVGVDLGPTLTAPKPVLDLPKS